MNISNQLKNYRKELNISQEGLAEIVHVSRQTISNWENNKSYPDLQSLVLISECFKVSLDELVKGDLVNMKNEVDRGKIVNYCYGMIIGFILMIASLPLIKRIPPYGVIITVISFVFMFACSIKIEIIKKNKNVQTYNEILNYVENGQVPGKGEKHKNLIGQKIFLVIISALITGILAYIVLKVF